MNLQNIFKAGEKFLVDNAPAIFTGLAVGGVIETTILTVQAVPKVEDKLWEAEQTKAEELDKREVLEACWKECIPPALSLLTTIYFILKANQAHVSKEMDLAALASLYETKHTAYKNKNRELFGEENDKRVEEEVRKDKMREKIFPERSEEYLVYDEVTNQYFYATYKEKEHAQEQLNRILGKESAVAYNFLLSCFRNADHKTRLGNLFGWFLDDTFTEYYYWNESFYGRPYAELEFVPSGEVTDQQEEIYILRCNIEPLAENHMDDSEAMDSQDKHAL